MHFKKVLSALLCGAMLLSAMPMASAAYQTPVTVTSEAAIFNVTIPTALPVSVNDHGAVTTATNATITNDSWGPIVIAGLAVTGTNDWATADYDSANMTAEKVDTKKVAMSINTCKTTGANTINFQQTGFNSINGKGGTQLITYDAKLPAQASAINSQDIVNTTFTVAWDMATGSTSADNVFVDSNPMTSAQVTAAKLVFDSATGTIKAGSTKPTGTLNLPSSVDGVKVTSIGDGAFYNCSGLTSVTIPTSVTTIANYAFKNCSGLKSITIPSSVNSIGSCAFYCCTGLLSITIPSGVTSIKDCTFTNCTGLTSVTILSGVTSIATLAFSGCTSLKTFISESPAYRVENSRYLIQNSNNQLVIFAPSGTTSAIIPSSVTSIGEGVFMDCSGLTSITIPTSVTTIANYAFENCSGLKSITIPSGVNNIGDRVFYGCFGLTSITIPSGVTSIGMNTFYNIPHIYYYGTATGSPWGAKAMN